MAEGAQGAVGGAWRQDAEKWLNRGGAVRSRGVLAEPVALQPREVAQRRHSQKQGVRKHPAPEGALRRGETPAANDCPLVVRKHPAPEGALRRHTERERVRHVVVRKHPAPEGALRRNETSAVSDPVRRQKAPSTRRCIKTCWTPTVRIALWSVRKHPAPEGALRRGPPGWQPGGCRSESTQHQKVH